MSLTITHKQARKEAIDHNAPSAFAAEIDELGKMTLEADKLALKIAAAAGADIKKHEALMKVVKAKEKALKDKISEAYDSENADETFIAKGIKFILEIGKKGSSRSITNMKLLAGLVGEETWWAKCSFNLKDADAYLTPDEALTCIKTDRVERKIAVKKKV